MGKRRKRPKYVQIYSREKLPRDLTFGSDPYESEKCRKDLKALGVAFYRDNRHAEGAIWEDSSEVWEGWYYQFRVIKGRIRERFCIGRRKMKWIVWDMPVRVCWMTQTAVNNIKLNQRKQNAKPLTSRTTGRFRGVV